MRTFRNARGFTVIEMLVVIAIIAVLAGMLLATITAVQNKSKARLAAEDLKGFYIALERYHEKYGEYPRNNDDFIKAGDGVKLKFVKLLMKNKFFSCEASQLSTKGGNTDLLDPWGNKYRVLAFKNENDQSSVPGFPLMVFQRSGIYVYSTGGQDGDINESSNADKKKACIYVKDE